MLLVTQTRARPRSPTQTNPVPNIVKLLKLTWLFVNEIILWRLKKFCAENTRGDVNSRLRSGSLWKIDKFSSWFRPAFTINDQTVLTGNRPSSWGGSVFLLQLNYPKLSPPYITIHLLLSLYLCKYNLQTNLLSIPSITALRFSLYSLWYYNLKLNMLFLSFVSDLTENVL